MTSEDLLEVNTLRKALIFVGAPGSGKGTVSKMVEGGTVLSLGDQIRKRQNELPPNTWKLVESGFLLPDNWVLHFFREAFPAEPPLIPILDGATRTRRQAEEVILHLQKQYGENIFTIQFDIDEEVATKRLLKRGRTPDDKPKIIQTRMRVYEENFWSTMAVLKKNTPIYHIDSNGDEESYRPQLAEVLSEIDTHQEQHRQRMITSVQTRLAIPVIA